MEDTIEIYKKLLSEKGIDFEETKDGRLLARVDHRDDHGHTYQKLEIYKSFEGFCADFLDLRGDQKHNQNPVDMINKFFQEKVAFFSGN